ncbi:MAG: hypothetical protein Aurels2KO_57680 [Aureliella sp.]
MDTEYISYACQDLPLKKVKKYATQYDGADMAALMGATEDNFPFLVRDSNGDYGAMWWNAYSGIMIQMNDDDVQVYALVQYLLEQAYPRFDSIEDAEKWSIAHDWPRKSLGDG